LSACASRAASDLSVLSVIPELASLGVRTEWKGGST